MSDLYPYFGYLGNIFVIKRSFYLFERVSIYVRINERKSLVSLSFPLGSLWGCLARG